MQASFRLVRNEVKNEADSQRGEGTIMIRSRMGSKALESNAGHWEIL